ncbi:hypothetical protein [Variovorax paradoxus]|uniref:hypothetical protein n=1 Tax=Variovorax paradoxus TaxID=34073 RepID=UPI003D64BF98
MAPAVSSTFHFLTAMQPGFRTPLRCRRQFHALTGRCAVLAGKLKRGSKIETSIFKIGTLFSVAAAGKIGVGYK